MSGLPARSRVVVVGGGVIGCSVAYHLASMGCTDVLLLERHQYGSGTTWHAAGNLETFRADPLLGELVAYGMSLYPQLEAESEQSIGWRTCGRVMFTADPHRQDDFLGLPRLGALRGVEIEALSPEEVVTRLPILSPDGVLAGAWIPGDGRLNPVDLVSAYARAARRMGVTTLQRVKVLEVLTCEDRVVGVRTDQGDVECESVVVAAGMWSPELAATCGVSVPLHGVEHMYVVTKPLEEVGEDLPMFLSYDERLYGREEGGGLLVGFFDENAVPLSPDRLPSNFEFSLLPPNWDQISANLDIAMRRFPILADAEIRTQYNGPESFTPDVKMLLGETAEVAGLFVSAGLNSSGIALAAGAGRLTAEWVLEGHPSVDASRLDVQRFSPAQGDLSYRRARASEAVTFMCRRPGPGVSFGSARDAQISPLHERLVEQGAQMGPAQTWERPLWFGTPGSAAESVATEVRAARTGVTVTDRSSDTKMRVTAEGVNDALGQSTARIEVGSARLVALLDEDSAAPKAMPWVARLDRNEWLFVVEADQATRLRVWLRNHLPSALVVDESASWGAVSLRGPHSQVLAARVVDGELPALDAVRAIPGQGSAAWLLYVAPGPSLFILVSAADTLSLYSRLFTAGGDLGVAAAGYWADEEAWVSAGIPRFGHESGPSGALRLVGSSVGAPGAESGRPVATMATFRAAAGMDFLAAEGAPLVSDGVTIGYVTTAVPEGTTDGHLLRGVVPSSQGAVYAVVDGHDILLEPLPVTGG